ncbi:MAG: hypothetical protein EA417_13175 [Gammaproteobacteria bacterium]|nr:MAG: hypothetical protein EA417_13175 [Gammaproteobacteria bacterium]
MSYRFGDFTLDPGAGTLRGPNGTLVLRRQAFLLCEALLRHAPRLLDRDTLLNEVWGRTTLSPNVLPQTMSELRQILGDDPQAPKYIETVHRRGYRVICPVTEFPPAEAGPPVETSALPRRYSIAVLSPEYRGPLPELAALADAFARDLTNQLARSPRLYVAAYEPAPGAGAAPLTYAAIGRVRHVRYLTCSSVDRSGEGIQLRVALVHCESGAQVWSRRIALSIRPPQALLDTIVAEVATSILSEMQALETLACPSRNSEHVDSDAIIDMTEMLRSLYSRQRADEIVAHLSDLLASDPANVRARAGLAVQLAQNVVSAWTESGMETAAAAKDHIAQAQATAPNDPDVVAAAGIVAAMTGDCPAAVRLLTRAVDLDPNNPHVLAVLGWQHCYLNRDESGLAMIRSAERRAPQHPRRSIWAAYRGACQLKLDRYEDAVAAYQDSTDLNPNYHFPYIGKAVALAHLNRDAEATLCLQRALQISPGYRPDDWGAPPFYSPYCRGKDLSLEGAWAHLRRVWPP